MAKKEINTPFTFVNFINFFRHYFEVDFNNSLFFDFINFYRLLQTKKGPKSLFQQ